MKRKKETADKGFSLQTKTGQLHKKDKLIDVTADAFFLWLFVCGLEGALCSMFQIQVSLPVCFFGNFIISISILFLCTFAGKVRHTGLIIWCLLIILIGIFLQTILGGGMNLLLNQIMNAVGEHFPYMLLPYTVHIAEGYEVILSTAAMLWCSMGVALLGIYLMRIGNSWILGIGLVLLLGIQTVLGFAPFLVWNILLFFSVFLMWIRGHGIKLSGGRKRLGQLQIAVEILVLLLLILGVMQIFLPVQGYKKSDVITNLKNRVIAAVDNYRYSGSSKVLPEGDFQELGSWETSDKPVLQITMSTPESYYLRGFTGAEYTGTGWKTLENEKRWKNRDLFYWLHADGFYGQESLGLAAMAIDPENESFDKNEITVENINGNCEYSYVPYELYDTDEKSDSSLLMNQKIGDEGVVSQGMKGNRTYSYEALPDQVTKYSALTAALADSDSLTQDGKAYQELEGYYNQFAYENYLTISDSLKMSLSMILGDYQQSEDTKHADYAETKQNVLYVLQSLCTYSETQDVPWAGSDFVYDFLNNTKSGYSVQFASAAAMMFRYYQIPARYVEGYLVTPDDVENMTASEPYTLDETHAHTWVEYYQDGVGWLPFETTPSYMNVMNPPDTHQDISGVADGASQGQSVEEEEEEQEEEQQEEPHVIDWLFILEIALVVLIGIFILALVASIIWVILQRKKSKRDKLLFDSPDNRVAVCALFNYSMNILAVAGMHIRNVSLYRYQKQVVGMFDEDTGNRYMEVVKIRQEAVYSAHDITREQRQTAIDFKDRIWRQVYGNADLFQKMQLKFIYFL